MAEDIPAGLMRVTAGDTRRVAQMLARAFADDPLMRYAIPDADQRRRLLPFLIGLNVRYGCRYGAVYATGAYEGSAIWLPPGQTDMTLMRMLRVGMFVAPLKAPWPIVRRLAVAGERSAALHQRCAPEPHWYLAQIGVAPSHQRQGVASRLLRPMLARLDAEGLPCYLETENAANIALYQRFGFQVVTEDPASGGAPPIWAMRR